jgi:hypothetical protein
MKVVVAGLAVLAFSSTPRDLDGRVLCYAAQSETAILDIGTDQGVVAGMKFTVYRDDQYVGGGVIKEAARDWSAMLIEWKTTDPQAGDRVSSQVLR